LAWLGRPLSAMAAEDARGGIGDRLERLERRVNELAERQEQLLQRLGGLPERQLPPLDLSVKRMEAAAVPAGPLPSAHFAIINAIHKIGGLVRMCLLVGLIFNILLAVWIYTDIRKRGEGSGIFIFLALLAGIPASIIYSIVRLGDKKP